MDIERALVTKIIWTGQIEEVLSRNITSDMFADDECREVFKYLVGHTKQYGSAPSVEVAKHVNPDFEWLSIQDSLDWLIDEFTIVVKRRLANDYLEELARAADDPVRARNIDSEFLEISRRLVTAIPSPEISRFNRDAAKRIKEYEKRKAEGTPNGIPFGYPTLDELTGGLQKHELATVLGFTNVGKSTLLRSLAFNFWSEDYTPLYISLEMESRVIMRIFDAMAARLDYAKLKQLALDDFDMKKWRQHAERIKDKIGDIPVIDAKTRITPDQVFAEIVRYKPDVVVLDYVGLMKSSSMQRGISKYQQLSEITQDLKHIARTMHTPIIMAAQTNRGGGKDGAELDNVADSISIAQDSDLVFGLFQDQDMADAKLMEIRVNKNRDGKRGKLKAIWDFDRNEFREKTHDDRFKRNGTISIETETGAKISFTRNRVPADAAA